MSAIQQLRAVTDLLLAFTLRRCMGCTAAGDDSRDVLGEDIPVRIVSTTPAPLRFFCVTPSCRHGVTTPATTVTNHTPWFRALVPYLAEPTTALPCRFKTHLASRLPGKNMDYRGRDPAYSRASQGPWCVLSDVFFLRLSFHVTTGFLLDDSVSRHRACCMYFAYKGMEAMEPASIALGLARGIARVRTGQVYDLYYRSSRLVDPFS
jgi:hypothetical protein